MIERVLWYYLDQNQIILVWPNFYSKNMIGSSAIDEVLERTKFFFKKRKNGILDLNETCCEFVAM